MAATIIVKALSELFDAAQVKQITAAIAAILAGMLTGSQKWQYIVSLYHDGKMSNADKKRSLAATFKAACNAKGIGDDSAKSMFWTGTDKAEIALGYKAKPVRKPKVTANGTKTAASATKGEAGTIPEPTLKAMALARELTDRALAFQTSAKLRKVDTEEFGKITALIALLNIELGNGPTMPAPTTQPQPQPTIQ